MNFTGGCRSATEARQIVIDVSKVIAYCAPSKFTWRAIFNHQVQQDGIGPDGIITKIDRICHLLKYLSLEVQEFEKSDDIPSLKARFEGWKASFKKEKPRLDHEREARNEGKKENALESISTLFSNKHLLSDVQQIVLDAESSINDENDATKVATYLFLCLTYKNMQRPAPAINLTIEEAEDVREGANNLVYVLSRNHKTARSLGPARLGMEPVVYAIFDKYIKRIRSNIPTAANTTNALVTGNGKPFTQYLHYIRLQEYGITNMPNPTSCRKEAATKAVSLLSKEKMETVSRHHGTFIDHLRKIL